MKTSKNFKSERLEMYVYVDSFCISSDINILQIQSSVNFLTDIVLINKVDNLDWQSIEFL